jgi:hypothetical protein
VPERQDLDALQLAHEKNNRVLTQEQLDTIYTAESAEAMLESLKAMPAGINSRWPDTYSTFLHATARRVDQSSGTIPADLLIANGADIHAIDSNGSTPLHIAALNGNIKVARILLNSGAEIDPVNVYGHTPLISVCSYDLHQGNLKEMVDLLISAGASVKIYIPIYNVEEGESRTPYGRLKENWEQYKNEDAKIILEQWEKPPRSLR